MTFISVHIDVWTDIEDGVEEHGFELLESLLEQYNKGHDIQLEGKDGFIWHLEEDELLEMPVKRRNK